MVVTFKNYVMNSDLEITYNKEFKESLLSIKQITDDKIVSTSIMLDSDQLYDLIGSLITIQQKHKLTVQGIGKRLIEKTRRIDAKKSNDLPL